MNGKLERDVLIVFATWFVVLYLVSGFPIADFGMISAGVALVWGIGLAAGIAATWVVSEGGMALTRRGLATGTPADAKVKSIDAVARIMDSDKQRTLHEVPLPVVAEPEKGKIRRNLFHSLPWWVEYEKRHPLHARVLTDVYAVMESKPDLPASPAGGHGGLSLIRHSMNVTSSILALAPSWEYAGLRDRKGNVIQPLHDISASVHRLAGATPLSEPILPLLAFAHDIGKVDCYAMSKTGVVTEVLGGHGERGASLLRKLSSVAALPQQERDALLLGVEFYHHLSNMPTSKWIADRIRSLTALLYVADCDASAGETGKKEALEEALERYRGAKQGVGQSPPPMSDDGMDEDDQQGEADQDDQGDAAEEPLPAASAQRRPPRVRDRTVVERHWSFEDGRTPMDVFEEVMSSPGAINSKNKEARVAFMKDGWIYIFEMNFRERAAALIPDQSLLERGTRGAMHPFTRDLLRMLDEQGLLKVEHEGLRYSYRRALWQATASANGSAVAIFVVKAQGMPFLESIPDADHVPVIQKAFWGEKSAINKKAGVSQPGEFGEQEDAGEDDLPLEEGDDEESLTTPSAAASDLPPLPPLPVRGTAPEPLGGLSDDDLPAPAAATPYRSGGKPLTYEALQALGACGAPVYSMTLKKIASGQTIASFDPDALAADYSFDLAALPEGIQAVTGKVSGRVSLVVIL